MAGRLASIGEKDIEHGMIIKHNITSSFILKDFQIFLSVVMY